MRPAPVWIAKCAWEASTRREASLPRKRQWSAATHRSFEANKSTKGASKLRRDLINAEISNLRDLLPLPSSTRQRLSQLQLMALVCVYVRKANYFQHSKSTPHVSIMLMPVRCNLNSRAAAHVTAPSECFVNFRFLNNKPWC
ncbi:hypothetical protein MRX96_018689 [Rhipicephalus microplus]